jgi:hypothetical protein
MDPGGSTTPVSPVAADLDQHSPPGGVRGGGLEDEAFGDRGRVANSVREGGWSPGERSLHRSL